MEDRKSIKDLKNLEFDYFENLILGLIKKYKEDFEFKSWYAAVGDNYNGNVEENCISIGMYTVLNKIKCSKIRIPKNDVGKKVIEKFTRSYLNSGIKKQEIINNEGQNLNTVGYFETNDGKMLEVFTVNSSLNVDDKYVDINYYDSSIDLTDDINDKIDYLNDVLGLEENKKTR